MPKTLTLLPSKSKRPGLDPGNVRPGYRLVTDCPCGNSWTPNPKALIARCPACERLQHIRYREVRNA